MLVNAKLYWILQSVDTTILFRYKVWKMSAGSHNRFCMPTKMGWQNDSPWQSGDTYILQLWLIIRIFDKLNWKITDVGTWWPSPFICRTPDYCVNGSRSDSTAKKTLCGVIEKKAVGNKIVRTDCEKTVLWRTPYT